MFGLSSQGDIVHAARDKLGNILVIDYRKQGHDLDSVFERAIRTRAPLAAGA